VGGRSTKSSGPVRNTLPDIFLELQRTGSAQCDRPPRIAAGANPYAQSLSNIDTSKPLLNLHSFGPANSFNFYTGTGPRVENFREPGYRDFDFGLQKLVRITERVTFQLRGDAFDVFNAHTISIQVESPFSRVCWISAHSIPMSRARPLEIWDGVVTSPRNIQVSGRISV
jgi:hypothetical protein